MTKAWFWRNVGDPLLRRIASRMAHLEQGRSPMQDGASWRSLARVGNNVAIHRDARLIRESQDVDSAAIGDFCQIYGQIWLFGSGRFSIGDHSFIGPGTRVWCANEVRIGSHVLLSHLVDVHDTNAHSLDWRERRAENVAKFEHADHKAPTNVPTAPVVIEDDVWVGFKSTILKGVTLGRGCVVAAGSVVTKDVPPFTVVAGNPAIVIKDVPQ